MAKDYFQLQKNKRILYLTKDLNLVYEQLYNGLNLRWENLRTQDLIDNINTDLMTPFWVCFDYKPEDIAKNAYAGFMHNNKRLFETDALTNGNFEIIVSGKEKGSGSSRETAAQCEKWSGIRLVIASSFAPIYENNCINLGIFLSADHEILHALQDYKPLEINELLKKYQRPYQQILLQGGLLHAALGQKDQSIPEKKSSFKTTSAKTMVEKLIAKKANNATIQPGDLLWSDVDGGYSHEFTTAQVDAFLQEYIEKDYVLPHPKRFAAFEDHLVYAEQAKSLHRFLPKILILRQKQKEFCQKTGALDFCAKNNKSPGICHEVARELLIRPGDLIVATDSHTCMGGCLNSYSYGVGSTEYASVLYTGKTLVQVPHSIRFELVGQLAKNCTSKDLMLFILSRYAKDGLTINRIIEFDGPGLVEFNMDERATLCNMATECSAKSGICPADEKTFKWLKEHRPNKIHEVDSWRQNCVLADKSAFYEGGIHIIELDKIEPMIAHPGDPEHGIASDPKNGINIKSLKKDISIDIAYGGSCTAGKLQDLHYYAQAVAYFLKQGRKVHPKVRFYIQYGSALVEKQATALGYDKIFKEAGVVLLHPGCGACIGCGPGISETKNDVTISAINRNYQGRSGPGQLYLASPLSVAASAFAGKIVEF